MPRRAALCISGVALKLAPYLPGVNRPGPVLISDRDVLLLFCCDLVRILFLGAAFPADQLAQAARRRGDRGHWDVAVGVHRDPDAGVPKQLLDDLLMLRQLAQQQARRRVPEIVDADRRETGSMGNGGQRAPEDPAGGQPVPALRPLLSPSPPRLVSCLGSMSEAGRFSSFSATQAKQCAEPFFRVCHQLPLFRRSPAALSDRNGQGVPVRAPRSDVPGCPFVKLTLEVIRRHVGDERAFLDGELIVEPLLVCHLASFFSRVFGASRV